ncbi:threonine aldolase family protein [Ramlibacter sp.]|uniref:threonine aldolase family protein n=1 Tax=Ramlibacter sp. TaxID=1917967 RepID=UPI003D143F18
MTTHDFRSDTVTLPTPAMMAAIASARLGDAARGDDPTVNELEALSRELTGKEDALFVPSGAMANLSAVMAHGCRGGEVILEEQAHIYNSEGGGLSVLAGAIARPVKGSYGVMNPEDVRASIRASSDLALAPTRLICLENTHNASGGSVAPLENMEAIHAVAREAGLPVHLDGARLFNAATYLNVPISQICRHVDSVWFAVCKGLGSPVGAVLAGPRDFMRDARRAAKMLGGGMRQAGLIAAPAIVALQDPYTQHRRDHELARQLAVGLAAIDASLVDVPRVQTNIVNCFVDRFADDALEINKALAARGVLTNARRTKIRFVTHSQVDEAAVKAAIDAFARIIFSIPRKGCLS